MYLFATLGLIACLLVGWLMWPSHRTGSLLSAALHAPFGLLGAVFVPAYWRPDHQFTFVRGVGVEDFVFCFACGGVCWIAAAVGSGRPFVFRPSVGQFLTRFGCWAAGSLLAVLAAWLTGYGILAAMVAGFTASGLVVLYRVPHTHRLILPGAVGFGAVYASVGWVVLTVFPRSASFWASEALCGHRVFGLPVEELVWACSFGATWPVVVGYCLGAKPIGVDRLARGRDRGRTTHPARWQ